MNRVSPTLNEALGLDGATSPPATGHSLQLTGGESSEQVVVRGMHKSMQVKPGEGGVVANPHRGVSIFRRVRIGEPTGPLTQDESASWESGIGFRILYR